jgi:glucan phosphoethanolaminetransferase (alkaline phosphatase superfamily)
MERDETPQNLALRWRRIPRMRRAAVVTLTSIAVINLFRLTYDFGYNSGAFEFSFTAHGSRYIGFLESFLIPITLGLFLAAIFISTPRPIGILLSLVGLISVFVFYYLWYRGTLGIIHVAEVEDFWRLPGERQRLLPLSYATWWDVAVLAIVIMLFVWHIKTMGPFVTQLVGNYLMRSSSSAHADTADNSRQQLDQVTPLRIFPER